MEIEINDKGIEARGLAYKPEDSVKPQPWKAEWIWLDKAYEDCQKSCYTLFCNKQEYKFAVARFKQEIILRKDIKSVKAWVSADVKYRLFLNGVLAGRGPAEVGGDYDNKEAMNYWFYDSYDFTCDFKPGANVICAEVLLLPLVQADYSMGHGGFLFEAEINYNSGERDIIASNGEWKAVIAEAYLSDTLFDGRKELFDWMDYGSRHEQWLSAQVLGNPSGSLWNLLPREIPPLMETRLLPVEVKMPFPELGYRLQNAGALLGKGDTCAFVSCGAPFTFWLDFGRTLSGFLYLKAAGAAGTELTVGAEEIVGKTLRTETIILGEGVNKYESFYLQSIRYLKVTASNILDPVKLYEIGVSFVSYPVSYTGDFRCSDNILNKIYDTGRWTNQLCMQAYHMDSPVHQEALGCTGDYMIESLINYYTFGDRWLTRMDILRTAYLLEQKNGFMFHTSYSLLWIQMLVDYWQYTGDGSLFGQLAPTVDILLKRFEGYIGKTGLIESPPNFMFMDWVEEGKYNLHHPPKTIGMGCMNAFYFKALKNGALIFGSSKEYTKAAHCVSLADEIKQAFNRTLWVNEKGLYCDGCNSDVPTIPNAWLPEDADGSYFSQHTNALAVLYDIAPAGRQKEMMQSVFEDDSLIRAQPYFMHFILEAAAHSGTFDQYGLGQIRRWKALLDENPSSLKEVWYGFDCDYSHAWSGTPTYQLPSKVLGITPLERGFDVIGVKPAFGDLKWARGKVPTPKGVVHAGWSQDISASELTFSIPGNCRAIADIPLARIKNGSIIVNNEIVWLDGLFINNDVYIKGTANNGDVSLEVEEGNYRIVF